MPTEPAVVIRPDKEYLIRQGHPWIFSGAIKEVAGSPETDQVVKVLSASRGLLGRGLFGNGSIVLRMLTWEDEPIDDSFVEKRLRAALERRVRLGLTERRDLNAYRVVNAEGDLMPGLVIDRYAGAAVIQLQQEGLRPFLGVITDTLRSALGDHLQTVYLKSPASQQGQAGDDESRGGQFLAGSAQETCVVEYGRKYQVNWVEGQKTGFFLDQRDNRECLKALASGRRVLNAFSYSGGFSVAAVCGGARRVTSVDTSSYACAAAEMNVRLNSPDVDVHETIQADCFEFLPRQKVGAYDIVILDPPAFAKHRKALERATRGYSEINYQGFRMVDSGGVVLTFSCSQLVTRDRFLEVVLGSIQRAGRRAHLISEFFQAPCHLSLASHAEGRYLKGFAFTVD